MRKLDRDRIPAPGILVDPKKAGFEETAKAIAYFKKKKIPAGETFQYKVYRDPGVKEKLCELSYDKCAYCEANAVSTNDGDVEHFRPKGEVTEKNTKTGKVIRKPGYYWLGAKWENLYLSCAHCNQSRTQPTVDGTRRTMGKKNQFPLSESKKRLRSPDHHIRLEEPYRLLIDPCYDEPMDHLRFDENGLIYPEKIKQLDSEKGKHSIEVFALLRKKLVEARKTHAIIVRSMLKSYDLCLKYAESTGNLTKVQIALKDSEILKMTEDLKSLYHPSQPFSVMSYQLIKTHLTKKGIAIPPIDQ